MLIKGGPDFTGFHVGVAGQCAELNGLITIALISGGWFVYGVANRNDLVGDATDSERDDRIRVIVGDLRCVRAKSARTQRGVC